MRAAATHPSIVVAMRASLRISSGSFLLALLLISTFVPLTPVNCLSDAEADATSHNEQTEQLSGEGSSEQTTTSMPEGLAEEIHPPESAESQQQQEGATGEEHSEQHDSLEAAEGAAVLSAEASPEEGQLSEQDTVADTGEASTEEPSTPSAESPEEEASQSSDAIEEVLNEEEASKDSEVETSAEKPPSQEEEPTAEPAEAAVSSEEAPAVETPAPSDAEPAAAADVEVSLSATEQAAAEEVVTSISGSTEEESSGTASSTEVAEEPSDAPEEVPDPGPLPGEPAFEATMEPETSQDVPRDRSQLDHFAESEESPEFTAATELAIKELKKIYENSIKPLETVYEYNSITSRIFGDSEIHSKPMILIMGPAGSGKTTAVKYLLGIDSAAVPRIPTNGPVHPRDMFTIWRHGEEASVETGPELASDWVFASLQKYGLAATDRLTGLKLPVPLLKKVTIVDSPAIIESRGHVGEKRTFPVNDVYQWFIDRADLILLVFDPLKPDVGMELEAVLDQIKGREGQTRILVNKADTLCPSALATAEGDLLWNLSPMLGGNRPPQVYAVSLRPQAYKPRTCTKLIAQQEAALYNDFMDVVNNRVANKIASARRHAIRVRNHSKLVNLYLKAYSKAKGLLSNKKKVASQVVDDPFQYRVYQEVSFAKNVSRYDLPDPEVYREFFKQHKLFDFKKFEDLCTYFKGCPQDKLDIAIAYDLAEVMAKYKKGIGSTGPETSIGGEEGSSNIGEMPAIAA